MTISGKFLPKHQRLILACYPPGREVDKRPNASELSYLFYYVTTRRMKLAKVAAFLEKSVKSDVSHGRFGNVRVSLDIIKGLIEKCHENLNVFASYIVSILSRVLSSDDFPLCRQAVEVFNVFCKYHDQALFTGDPLYVQQFNNLVSEFLQFGYRDSGYDNMQWVDLANDASQALAQSTIISTRSGQSHIAEIVPVLLHVLLFGKTAENLKRIKDYADEGEEFAPAPADFTDIQKRDFQIRTKNQVGSMNALHYLFDCTSSMQIRKATREVVAFMMQKSAPIEWSTTLVEIMARWTPMQLRFEIVSSLVDVLTNLPLESTPNKLLVANVTSSLLGSSVNMIGLSVMDILRALLANQHETLRVGSEESGYGGMVVPLRKCIGALATHIYYGDQITDMVSEIMTRCVYRMNAGPNNNNNNNNHSDKAEILSKVLSHDGPSSITNTILLNDLKDVKQILEVASYTEHKTGNSDIPLSLWDCTEVLLSNENWEVRYAYVETLIKYLDGKISDEDRQLPTVHNFRPEREPLGKIIRALSVAAMDSSSHKLDYLIYYHLFVSIVTKLGLNGITRAIPFLLWIHDMGSSIEHGTSSKDYFLEQGVALTCMALAVFSTIAFQIQAEQAEHKITRAIKERQGKGLWYPIFDSPLTASLEQDTKQKRKARAGPVDPKVAAESIPLNREGLASTLLIPGCSPEVQQAIFGGVPPVSYDEAFTDNDSSHDLEFPQHPASVCQLAGLSLSYAATSHSERSDTERDLSIPRREFSPRIEDLKRVAAGSRGQREQRRIPSSRSTLAIREVLNGKATGTGDNIESFFNSLNISKK